MSNEHCRHYNNKMHAFVLLKIIDRGLNEKKNRFIAEIKNEQCQFE